MTELRSDATQAPTVSPWERDARRFADALLPAEDAARAVELALVVADFEGGIDDREAVLMAIRQTVTSSVLDHFDDAPECDGIPQLLFAEAQGKSPPAPDAAQHIKSCRGCKALARAIYNAERAFFHRRFPAHAPSSAVAPLGDAEPELRAPAESMARRPETNREFDLSEPPRPRTVEPEFDASAPATTVVATWEPDQPPGPLPVAGARLPIGGRLVGMGVAALIALAGAPAALIITSTGSKDHASLPATTAAAPAESTVTQDQAAAERLAAAERRAAARELRAAEGRRAADRRRRAAARRRAAERRRATAEKEFTIGPAQTQAPAAPTPTPTRRRSTPRPRQTTPTPRRTTPSPDRRTPAPDGPLPASPSAEPGRTAPTGAPPG